MQEYSDIIHMIAREDPKIVDRSFLLKTKRTYAREHNLSDIPSNSDLLRVYHGMLKNKQIEPSLLVEWLLRKRSIRSQSGIVPVQVLTKPYWCPGKCIFCPNDFTMPKSYINTEPGAMRALLNGFDPIKQVYNRLLSLTLTGHKVDKIEMIVLWWTWDVYPDDYKEEFIKWLYDACNTFGEFHEKVSFDDTTWSKYSYTIDERKDIVYPKTIEESQKINETADCRMIGLTIETRPEYVTDANCKFRRKLGVTRMEMGVQNLYDDVLDANKRWHSVQQAREAVHKLRQYGFKMSLHMMPWLYGSTLEKDIDSFVQLYNDPFFKPDEIKFYPTSVIPNTELHELYEKGEYIPLKTEEIQQIIRKTFLDIIPPYTRIKRLIRDIPSTEIVAGSNVTNLSQLTHQQIKKEFKNTPTLQALYTRLYADYQVYTSLDDFLSKYKKSQVGADAIRVSVVWEEPDTIAYRNFVSIDTRSREVRNKRTTANGLPAAWSKNDEDVVNVVIREYCSSVGREFFVTIEDKLGYLYGLVRVLLPNTSEIVSFEWLWAWVAMVRELHVYGQVASIKQQAYADTQAQHKWFGSQLMSIAEKLTQLYGYEKLSVIAGVGVKWYYRGLGYQDMGTYVQKTFSS